MNRQTTLSDLRENSYAPRSRQLLLVLSTCLLLAAAGCGTQSMLLGTSGAYLFTVRDVLTVPGQPVQLQARLQGGDFLSPRSGFIVRFYHRDKLFQIAQTDDDGLASVTFTPQGPGDYHFTAVVFPAGFADDPPPPRELLVAVRNPDEPLLIVDMDKTVVATGFHTVLIGEPTPAPGSQNVLHHLAQTHTIVYLTHRPDYFGPKSKQWLRDHHYPEGTILLSTLGGFLKGSGTFKTQMIRRFKTRFSRIEIGIGDKISDALAYHQNGLKAFLILLPEALPDNPDALNQLADILEQIPEDIQVVTTWSQIQKALSEGAAFLPAPVARSIREKAQTLQPPAPEP